MTEQEYIDVSELAKLRMAKAILVDITPENSKVINPASFKKVLSKMEIWTQRLSEGLDVKIE